MNENEKEAENDAGDIGDGDIGDGDIGDGLEGLRAALTQKEVRFVEFLVTEAKSNHTEAARLAGYKDTVHLPRQAYRLRRKPAVRAYLDGLLNAHGMGKGEILRALSEIARMPWPEPFPVTMPSGEVVQVRADLRSKVEACRLLLIYHGALPYKAALQGFGMVTAAASQ